ncbi:hypothetical protein H072_6538 [Dactylellina haptotyla CBS 200.50]|uniref:FAD-binding domain-containing protein n=1 Tax=Dactylellina haptotyla (strain CBS 200.50) TaxID=1284197 RepID=S8A9L3_DACHA|nr:hypothetical protein H072_6538 [Dactylellina haptotyla CBS 200.50]
MSASGASKPNLEIVIIGGGIAGLGLAIALHSQGFQCTVYEQAPEKGRFSGAIMLAPNSLRILDTLGIYDRIRVKGWSFEAVAMKDMEGNTTDRIFLGSKKLFQYDVLRIYRNVFVKELQAICHERGINVKYETKYSHIVEERKDGVTFVLADGTQINCTVLIAADGIHSKVRKHVYPDIDPQYTGILVVCGAVKRNLLDVSEKDEMDGPVMYPGKNGAFVMAPQDFDASEYMAGTQRAFPAQTKEGWGKLAQDPKFLHGFLEEGIEDRQPIVQSAIRNIDTDSIYIWAFHTLPKLPKWSSEGGRIIILGDAAHAIPPTTGQGANQALEDVYSLALLMATKSEGTTVAKAVEWWQQMRQERIDKLLELTSKLNNLRMPIEEQKKLEAGEIFQVEDGGSGEQWRWLFNPELETRITEWCQQQENLELVE